MMKKVLAGVLTVSMMALTVVGCGNAQPEQTENPVEESTESEAETETEAETSESETEAAESESAEGESSADYMTGAEYLAADLDTEVTVLTYVQAHQSWWEDKVTVYSQTEDGAGVFIYELACSEEDAAKLLPGTPILVTGYKAEWSGEVEIMDATFEFVDAEPYVAEAADVSEVSADDLADYMNTYVSFKDLTVVDYNGTEEEDAFAYKWDNSGSHDENSDLYFTVQNAAGDTFTFTVESYLTGNDTDVYAAVEGLSIGDVIDVEGFMYWYEGPQTHVTSVTVK